MTIDRKQLHEQIAASVDLACAEMLEKLAEAERRNGELAAVCYRALSLLSGADLDRDELRRDMIHILAASSRLRNG